MQEIFSKKGGVAGTKIRPLLDSLSQVKQGFPNFFGSRPITEMLCFAGTHTHNSQKLTFHSANWQLATHFGQLATHFGTNSLGKAEVKFQMHKVTLKWINLQQLRVMPSEDQSMQIQDIIVLYEF